MNLFIVGSTGRTGRLVVEQAISRGHVVTAIVREPGTLDACAGLRVVVGDPLRAEDLASALAGHDAVISCLGQRSRGDANLLRDAATATLDAMHGAGVRRLLIVSQGLLFASRNPIIALLRLILARQVADSAAMEERVSASNLDWTVVRPPRLQEGGAPRGYRFKVGARPGGASAMQRADLAAFLLDEAEKEKHTKAVVGVTSA